MSERELHHVFNPTVAKKYGIKAAILIYHLQYWIGKNALNGKHIYDGNVWAYASARELSNTFHYMTEKTIKYELKKLRDADVIISGNHNKMSFDRTLWHAFKTPSDWLSEAQIESIKQAKTDHIDGTKLSNEKGQNCPMRRDKIVPPIPDKEIYIKNKHGARARARASQFCKPSRDDLMAYCQDKRLTEVDLDDFLDYYESNGWMIGRTKMKSWQHTISRWNRKALKERKQKHNGDGRRTDKIVINGKDVI